MAYAWPNAWYVSQGDGSTTGYYAVTKRPQNTRGRGRRRCAASSPRPRSATSASSPASSPEPRRTRPTPRGRSTKGSKTTDGTATWIEVTGQPGVNGDIGSATARYGSPARTRRLAWSSTTARATRSKSARPAAATALARSRPSAPRPASPRRTARTSGPRWARRPRRGRPRAARSTTPSAGAARRPRISTSRTTPRRFAAFGRHPSLTPEFEPNILSIDHTVLVPPSGSSALKAGATIGHSSNVYA